MSENSTTPADAGAGTPGADAAGAEAGNQPDPKAAERTFTQSELDAIVADRVKRAVPKDYESAKEKAAKLDSIEEQSKTDLQKANESATMSAKERDEARAEAAQIRRETAIQLEAARQGADSEIALALLSSSDAISIGKDGKITGAKEAVEALIVSKPNVRVSAIGAGHANGGEFGGNDQKSLAEQIQTLEAKGDRQSLSEARRLKITGFMTASP